MRRTVVIDCFWDSFPPSLRDHAVVAVDVIRSTTTAVTAVAGGRRCFPVPSLEAAVSLEERLEEPLLVGELGGNMPYGWHLSNSPAEIALRDDIARPMILLSSSGTRLIHETGGCEAGYAACLRNWRAQAEHVADRDVRVALMGAGTRGEFREEDQLCCSWMARVLIEQGYEASPATRAFVERWSDAPVDVIAGGKSAEYLRNTGQLRDLRFILDHVDDLQAVFPILRDEIERLPIDPLPASVYTPGQGTGS